MHNLLLINHPITTTEMRLKRMRELKDQIDELQAEYDMLKKTVIVEHFDNDDTFMTAKGLVLATYKTQIRTQFQTTEFKKAQPEMYMQFLEEKEIKLFLLK